MKKNVSFEKEIEFPSMIGEITSISLDHSLEFQSKNKIEGEFVVSGTYKMTEASTLEEKFSYPIPVEIELLEMLEEDTRKVSISNFNYAIVNDDILKCDIEVLVEGVEEVIVEEVEENKIEILEEDKKDENDLFEISKEEEKKIVEEVRKEEIPNQDDEVRECDGDMKEEEEKVIEEKITKERVEEEVVDVDKKEVEESSNVVENIQEVLSVVEKEEKDSVMNEEVSMEEKQESSNMSSLFQAFETSEETFTTYSVYIVRKEDSIEKIMDNYKVSRESLSEYNDLSEIEIGSKIIIPTCNE